MATDEQVRRNGHGGAARSTPTQRGQPSFQTRLQTILQKPIERWRAPGVRHTIMGLDPRHQANPPLGDVANLESRHA